MKSLKLPQLKQDEKDFILNSRKDKTVPEIARHLKRGDATIYAHFKAMGWKPFKNETPPRQASHPFRRQNSKLETFFIARKIRNANAEKK